METRPIIFSDHAVDSARKRGATKKEVDEAVLETLWVEARNGRFETKKDFAFNATWNGKQYKTKQVNPVFVLEEGTIVIITVYVFYF